LAQRLTRLAPAISLDCNGRELLAAPALHTLKASAQQIVHVPSSHHDDLSGVLVEASQEILRVPIPHAISVGLADSFAAALHRIVNHSEMQAHAIDRTLDRRIAEASRLLDVLD